MYKLSSARPHQRSVFTTRDTGGGLLPPRCRSECAATVVVDEQTDTLADGHTEQVHSMSSIGGGIKLITSSYTSSAKEKREQLVTPVCTDSKKFKLMFEFEQFLCSRTSEMRLWMNNNASFLKKKILSPL